MIEGYVSGIHRSPTRGRSIEFAEHREYTAGDDVKQVDWKVYARTDRYFVKQFEDETNLIGVLAVDTSRSMDYQSATSKLSKREYAQLVALTLAYFLLDQRDAAALATYSDTIHQYLEPSNQGSRWLDMIPVLEGTPTNACVDTGAALSDLASRLKRRSLVIIISDFLDDLENLARGCSHLRHHRHDVLLLQVLDRAELTFPFRQASTFVGMESSSRLTIDPAGLRSAYLKHFEKHQRSLVSLVRDTGLYHGLMVTDQNLAEVLPSILAKRKR